MKKRIIIDTDMGADDYIAIQLALLSKDINVEGVSLVHGNTTMDNVKKNVFKTLDMINMNNKVKVYEGESNPLYNYDVNTKDNAFGSNGFSDVLYDDVKGTIEKESAINFMIDKVNNNPNEISIVAIGPLTNIAKAIMTNKNFSKNIKELIIMGGAENYGNITEYAEFNFYNDPMACKIVFSSGIKNIIMIGFNVTKKVTINMLLEAKLKNANNKNANFIYDITRDSAKLDKEKNNTDGAIISDAINICYLIDNNILSLKEANVKIITEKNDHLGESVVSYDDNTNCMIADDVDSKKCLDIIFNTIL